MHTSCDMKIVILMLLGIVGARTDTPGTDCTEINPCVAINEICKNGFCKCGPGYIRNDQHCFPERNYGETCFFDVQCHLYPMVCTTKDNARVKRCDCLKFFEWDDSIEQCVHAENISSMISELEEQWDSAGRIANEAKSLFPGLVAAAVIVLVLGAILAAACTIYGCFSCSCLLDTGDDSKIPLTEIKVQEGASASVVQRN